MGRIKRNPTVVEIKCGRNVIRDNDEVKGKPESSEPPCLFPAKGTSGADILVI